MAKVTFHELSLPTEIRTMEKAINQKLSALAVSVTLMHDQRGDIGYAVSGISADGGKKVLDRVHRTVRAVVGHRRGRPPGKQPSHQVKCTLPRPVYDRLQKEAKRQKITPARLLRLLAEQYVA